MLTRKGRCLNFAGESTLHGVSHIANTKSAWFRRLCWLLFFLTMVATFTYFITVQAIKYLSYPKSTRIEIREQKPISFPSITICNQNLFRKSIITQSHPVLETILRLNYPSTGKPDVSNLTLTEEMDQINVTEESLKNLQPLEEMLITCKFRGSLINCKENLLLIPTSSGWCYIFNSYEYIMKHGSYETYSTGSAQGLYLRMNVNQSEYFLGPSSSAGFKVVLHDPRDFPDIESKAFVVRPGYETFVSVKLVKTENLPPPYEDSHCEQDAEKKLKYYESYGRRKCLNECMADYLLNICGCLHNMIVPLTKLTCNISTTITCSSPAEAKYNQERLHEKCNCKEKCEVNSYQASISRASFPSQPILDDVKESLGHSEDDIRKNFLELRIYFEELNYNYIKEYASYTLGNFWSDLGGQLGLCLGASVLTVLEFLDFMTCFFDKPYRKTAP